MRIWALALTRNRSAADDLVQEAAAGAWLPTIASSRNQFGAWIHRILLNSFITGSEAVALSRMNSPGPSHCLGPYGPDRPVRTGFSHGSSATRAEGRAAFHRYGRDYLCRIGARVEGARSAHSRAGFTAPGFGCVRWVGATPGCLRFKPRCGEERPAARPTDQSPLVALLVLCRGWRRIILSRFRTLSNAPFDLLLNERVARRNSSMTDSQVGANNCIACVSRGFFT